MFNNSVSSGKKLDHPDLDKADALEVSGSVLLSLASLVEYHAAGSPKLTDLLKP